MRVDLRDALSTRAHWETRRALVLSVVFALFVAVAAGVAGTSHFAGARWVPNWSAAHRARPKHPSSPPASVKPASIATPHAASHFPLALLVWIALGIIVTGAAIVVWRRWARRRALTLPSLRVTPVGGAREVPEPDPQPETLLTGIELALSVLDEQRVPADAIVRAWLGLEETAKESGLVRRPAETPTEFTSRILSKAFADDQALRTLLRLYLRTRFGDHPATSEDVADVRRALKELVRTWRTADGASAARRELHV